MKNNKFFGLDGLFCEFYKCFWEYILLIFFDLFISVYEKKELSYI